MSLISDDPGRCLLPGSYTADLSLALAAHLVTVIYIRLTVRTNNAAVVAPGAKKPTSVFSLERAEERARTLAHLSEPIARQDLDDAALLLEVLSLNGTGYVFAPPMGKRSSYAVDRWLSHDSQATPSPSRSRCDA